MLQLVCVFNRISIFIGTRRYNKKIQSKSVAFDENYTLKMTLLKLKEFIQRVLQSITGLIQHTTAASENRSFCKSAH